MFSLVIGTNSSAIRVADGSCKGFYACYDNIGEFFQIS